MRRRALLWRRVAFWNVSGDQALAWFTLDLGQTRLLDTLQVAPRNDQVFELSVTVSETVAGGKASGAVTLTCTTPNGGSTAPSVLRTCALPTGTSGRYVTVQSNKAWLRMYGAQVNGS